MMKEKVYKLLDDLKIVYEKFEHPPLFTCEDSAKHRPNCDFVDVKNLFIRNKNKSNLYLVVLPAKKRADLKGLQELLDDTKLSFAESDLLYDKLKVTQGAVSLFGIVNLDKPDIKVLIEKEVLNAKKVGFHPNVNTETIVFACADIPKILNHSQVKWQEFDTEQLVTANPF